MSKSKRRPCGSVISTVTLILGLVTLVVAALALVYHYVSERSFYKKWNAFQEDGYLD